MRRRFSLSLAAASMATVVGLVACEEFPVGPMPGSLLKATIEGSVDSNYEGNAVFSTLQRGSTGFLLRSEGMHLSNEGFQFRSSSMPAEGAYALGQETSDISARYSIRQGNTLKRFDAAAGEIVVTSASEDSFEGTFYFNGRLASECDVSRPNMVTCKAVSTAGEQPIIEVSGSIRAVPDRRLRR